MEKKKIYFLDLNLVEEYIIWFWGEKMEVEKQGNEQSYQSG